MRNIKRLIACLMAGLLIFAAGCGIIEKVLPGSPEPTPPAAATPAPTAAAPIEATPAPGAEISVDHSKLLNELDLEMFSQYATGDLLSFDLLLTHPEALGLEPPEATWGDFSYAAALESDADSRAQLERLEAIDRSALNEDERITYDTLHRYLTSSIESFPYFYYDEVLSPYNGIHTYFALNLVFYSIDSEEDIEGYLGLLADMPRYMGQVLQYEKEKSEAGFFMSEAALDKVLSDIEDFVEAGDTCFLLATFADSLDELGIAGKAADGYLARNEELVADVVAAYQALYDGLEALRGTNTVAGQGLCAYGEEGKRFFELGMQDAACCDITVAEAFNILETELNVYIDKIYDAAEKEPSVWDAFDTVDLSVGTTEENLAYLEALMADYYPALAEHTVTFMDVPPELEEQFSGAAYLVPPVDDASENLIILNAMKMEEDTRYIDTIAHEGYPGHMYHYIYLRSKTAETGYMRQSLSLTGYYEAWSQSGEAFFDSYNDRFSNAYCTFMNANVNLGGLILPAMFSIGVNYYGWTPDDVAEYFAKYFGEESAEEYKQMLYDDAVANPFYFLEYAMGLCIFQQLLREAQRALGDNFDLKAFNTAYLEIGPAYFDTILPIMGAWVTEQKG